MQKVILSTYNQTAKNVKQDVALKLFSSYKKARITNFEKCRE